MSKCDTIVPLIYAMKKRRDVIHTAADTIKKMFDMMIPELVVQVCPLKLCRACSFLATFIRCVSLSLSPSLSPSLPLSLPPSLPLSPILTS